MNRHITDTPCCWTSIHPHPSESNMADPCLNKMQASRDPESPTTVHPLNFEDDSVLEVASQTGGGTTSGPPSPRTESASPPPPPPPPKPARLNPHQQQEHTLREAFPTLDPAVVRAVLTASGWNMERAFHALLGIYFQSPPPASAIPPSLSYEEG